jgi:hypothetical protein
MSDYNNPNNFDKYGNPIPSGTPYEPVESTGRAPYVLLGLLVLIGIIGGALYFNGTPNASRRGSDVANAPPAASDTVRSPAATPGSPGLPPAGRSMDATPAPSTTPAPAGSATDKQ